MPESLWYCARDGQRLGPFGFAQLQQMTSDGAVRPHDLVLKEGDQGWRAASDVPGLMPAGPGPTPSAPTPGTSTPAPGSPPSKWVVRGLGGVVALVLVGLVVRNAWNYAGAIAAKREVTHQLEEEVRRIEEEKKRQVPPEAIQVRKDQGAFSHDLRLKNASTVSFGRCDVKLVVFYENGKRSEFARYWTDWAPQVEKVVNVPAEGNVERVDLTGTVTDPATGQPRTLASVHEWKPGKSAPAAGQ